MHIPASAPIPVRVARVRRGSIAVIATLSAAVLLSACGSSGSSESTAQGSLPKRILNTQRVERSIEQSVFSQRHLHAKVSCPKVVPQEKGQNFTCTATVGKTKTSFPVTQKNDSGYVTYRGQ
jgi:hypothetical protein